MAFTGSLWQTRTTGMVHRTMNCRHINGEIVDPIAVQDVTEASVVAEHGHRACSTCFPSAPTARVAMAAGNGVKGAEIDISGLSTTRCVVIYFPIPASPDKQDSFLNMMSPTEEGWNCAIGFLTWDRDTKEVELVYVPQQYRHKGVASELWRLANTRDRLKMSGSRTPMGDGWAHSLGVDVPENVDPYTSQEVELSGSKMMLQLLQFHDDIIIAPIQVRSSRTALVPSDKRKTRTPQWDAEDEELHPRAEDGEFTKGPDQNAGTQPEQPAAPRPPAQPPFPDSTPDPQGGLAQDPAQPGQPQEPAQPVSFADHMPHPDTTGTGSADDPVVTASVDDAAVALAMGLHVELHQPQQVSTLLDKLAEQIAAAKAAGTKLDIDLCNVTVKGTNLFCAESKGIPRVQMPQLKVAGEKFAPDSRAVRELTPNAKGEYDLQPLFLQHLKDQGYTAQEVQEAAINLKATQNQLNGGKIAGMTNALLGGKSLGDEPIFVSEDDYIVDGHHRWAANAAADYADGKGGDYQMSIWRIDVDIITLLDLSNKFAAEYGSPQASVTASRTAGCSDCGPSIEEMNAHARAKMAGKTAADYRSDMPTRQDSATRKRIKDKREKAQGWHVELSFRVCNTCGFKDQGQSGPGSAQEIRDHVAQHSKTASLSDTDRAYVVEGILERAFPQFGERVTEEEAKRQAQACGLHERNLYFTDDMTVHGFPADAHGGTSAMGYCCINAKHNTIGTVLHEIAHVHALQEHGYGQGHGPTWQSAYAKLLNEWISPAVGERFLDLMDNSPRTAIKYESPLKGVMGDPEIIKTIPPEHRADFAKLLEMEQRRQEWGSSGKWYHASKADLPAGTMLVPGGGAPTDAKFYEDQRAQDEFMGAGNRADHVWITPDREDASFWAAMLDADFIYEVDPDDPRPWGISGVDGYVCSKAKILKRLSTTGSKHAVNMDEEGVTCPACKGAGKGGVLAVPRDDNTCGRCHGKGFLDMRMTADLQVQAYQWPSGKQVDADDLARIAIEEGFLTREQVSNMVASNKSAYTDLETVLRKRLYEMWARGELDVWNSDGTRAPWRAEDGSRIQTPFTPRPGSAWDTPEQEAYYRDSVQMHEREHGRQPQRHPVAASVSEQFINEVIEVAEGMGWRWPAWDGDCFTAPDLLVEALDNAAIDSEVVDFSVYQGGIPIIHRAVKVEGDETWIIDVTASQFNDDLPPVLAAPEDEYQQILGSVWGVSKVVKAGAKQGSYTDKQVARGMEIQFPSTHDDPDAVAKARKFIAGDVKALDIIKMLHNPVGIWWGMLDRHWDIEDIQDYAQPNGQEESVVKTLAEYEQDIASGYENANFYGGEMAVVLVADTPEGWDPDANEENQEYARNNPLMGNSFIPEGTPLRITEVHYNVGDGWRVLKGFGSIGMQASRNTYIASKAAGSTRYYHGSWHDLPDGTVLLPSSSGEVQGNWKLSPASEHYAEFVWLTDSPAQALSWGKSSRDEYVINHPGETASDEIRVYEVKPLTPIISWAERARGSWANGTFACFKARIEAEVDLSISPIAMTTPPPPGSGWVQATLTANAHPEMKSHQPGRNASVVD